MTIPAGSQVLEDGDEALLPKPTLAEGEEFASLDAEPAAAPAAPAPAAETAPAAPAPAAEDELPPEFKGKTPAQLAKMVRDAQQLIGRQGQELGTYRRKVDEYIQASLAAATKKPAAPAEEAKPLDDTDFFAQPKEAIARAIAEHPLMKQIAEKLGSVEQERVIAKATQAVKQFRESFPDYQATMADPEFQKWIQASPIRTSLMQRAHRQFDVTAASDVFGTWQELKGARAAASAAPAATAATSAAAAKQAAATLAKRKQTLAAAKAPSAGNSAPASGSKPIYRRADILKLMETDPDRYEQLAPEIQRAYAEKRVR